MKIAAAVAAHLSDRRNAVLAAAITKLEAGIAAGVVRNVDFNDAKDTFNRAVDESTDAFLAAGPHVVGRNGEPHHQSDWWLDAYDADAFVSGASYLTAAIKRASKVAGLKEYADFLGALLPLHTLLQNAKPLIAKRGDARAPVAPKSAEQIARDAAVMTCQCCGGKFLANTGTMAHHGYQRPGGGWQTASCMGAKHLPFEVSRARLGELIESLRHWKESAEKGQASVRAERIPVILVFADNSAARNSFGERPNLSVEVTRETFEAVRATHEDAFRRLSWESFDVVKERDLAERAHEIAGVVREIKAQQARFNGWKPAALVFDMATKTWEPGK